MRSRIQSAGRWLGTPRSWGSMGLLLLAHAAGPGAPGFQEANGARLDLDGFVDLAPTERRARAERFASEASIDELDRLRMLGEDPDRDVRSAFVDYLSRRDHAGVEVGARVAALREIARADPLIELRLAALEALGQFDDPLAIEALAELIERLPPDEAAGAVDSLPQTVRSLELVRSLVARGFASDSDRGERRPPDPVLAAALPLHGRLVADALEETASREGVLWVRGLSHPSPAVRRASADAFQAFLGRLRTLGEASRALAVLVELERFGLDPKLVHYHRARLAFYPGGDPSAAASAARAMRSPAGGAGATVPASTRRAEDRLWLSRSLYLEAMARAASGEPNLHGLFDEAAFVADAMLAERFDRGDDVLKLVGADAVEFRALLEVARIVYELMEGAAPIDLLGRARRAHALALEAQLEYTRISGEALVGWDVLLDSEISPFRLVFAGLEFPGLTIARGLEVQGQLGRVLATVAPAELPGFEPLSGPAVTPEIHDPLEDPRRRDLLIAILDARLDGVGDDIRRLRRRIQAAQQRAPGVVPVEELGRMDNLERRRRLISSLFLEVERSGGAELLEARIPAALGLWLARDLRNDGRAAEGRALAIRMRSDMEANGLSRWWYYSGLERLAQIEMAIGSSYSDEGEPREAETELLKAVERLEGIERRMSDNGATDRQLQPVRWIRSTALVSLAVNANVKLKDPELARRYFERAYELRKDDFMKVLLACYRARSGREAEARALLAELRPTRSCSTTSRAPTRCWATPSWRSTTSSATSRRITPANRPPAVSVSGRETIPTWLRCAGTRASSLSWRPAESRRKARPRASRLAVRALPFPA